MRSKTSWKWAQNDPCLWSVFISLWKWWFSEMSIFSLFSSWKRPFYKFGHNGGLKCIYSIHLLHSHKHICSADISCQHTNSLSAPALAVHPLYLSPADTLSSNASPLPADKDVVHLNTSHPQVHLSADVSPADVIVHLHTSHQQALDQLMPPPAVSWCGCSTPSTPLDQLMPPTSCQLMWL